MKETEKEELRKEFDNFYLKSDNIVLRIDDNGLAAIFEWFYKIIEEERKSGLEVEDMIIQRDKVITTRNSKIQELQREIERLNKYIEDHFNHVA